MAEDVVNELGLPEVTPISEIADLASTRWQYKHSDLVDKLIVILDYEPIETRYGDAFLARCVVDEEVVSVLIGSTVLCSQLEKVFEHLPVSATITKVSNYYTFV